MLAFLLFTKLHKVLLEVTKICQTIVAKFIDEFLKMHPSCSRAKLLEAIKLLLTFLSRVLNQLIHSDSV